MADMQVPLASLSLTHVNYNPDDPVSYVAALLALVPQAMCIVYVTLIWSSREVEVLLMFAGQMLNEALNWVLKHIIRQERPPEMTAKGYGMPSSHAQFMSYFFVSVALFLLARHTPNPLTNSSPATFAQRAAFSALVFAAATAVAVSRIYLSYHTAAQVGAGYAIGVGFAGAWFAVTARLRTDGWIERALDMRLARALRMRDLVVGEDLVEAGWQKWEARRAELKREREKRSN